MTTTFVKSGGGRISTDPARPTLFVLSLAFAASCGGDQMGSRAEDLFASREYLTLAEIGIEAELGVREQDDRLSLLQQPLDVAFLRNEVFVLDASPPWIRVFDRQGASGSD